MPVFSTDYSEAVQLLMREHDLSLSNFANYDMTLRSLPKTVVGWSRLALRWLAARWARSACVARRSIEYQVPDTL
jgi:hypothetical protein